MPRSESAYRAWASACATRPRAAGGQRATICVCDPCCCSKICTRPREPSSKNEACLGGNFGPLKVRSICCASLDRTMRRSVAGAPVIASVAPARDAALPNPRDAPPAGACARERCCMTDCAGVFRRGDTAAPAVLCTCKAEYHACESARRSHSATGVLRTVNPAYGVIMHAAYAPKFSAAWPRYCRLVF